MKNNFIFFLFLLVATDVFAQAPQKMTYQAVIRNSSSVLITSTMVGMQLSILQGSVNGTPVYVETQIPTTNANGLASLEIGNGVVVLGNFSTINWANGPYFIKSETDPTGGNNYTITGAKELLSVPYALFAVNGNPGPQGPVGATGAAGTNGINGATGAAGLNGINGATGANGINGATGANGINGATGAIGATGSSGANGINGATGATGAAGTNGINGATGATGVAGTNGINGATGATGVAGTNGINGATGATGVAGTNGINGATGATGVTGATGNIAASFNITANFSSDYFIGNSADYIGGDNSDPVLYLHRGLTYTFVVNASNHPFRISTTQFGPALVTGITNNDVSVGTLTFKVPMDAPSNLFYYCINHLAMSGTLIIVQ
jgi:hypothetical protein